MDYDLGRAYDRLDRAIRGFGGLDNVPGMKVALTRFGMRESGVRPPYVPLPEAKRKELAEKMAARG